MKILICKCFWFILFYSSLICSYHLNYFNIYSFLSFLILWLSWYLGSLVLLLEITFISVTICESESRSMVSNSLWPHGLYSPRNSPGQNTGVGSLSLLQGIFPTQGSNPCLPHCRQILYLLRHKGSPSILEWVAYPFSRGSSRPRNRIGVSCIADGFFTNWAIREALTVYYILNHLFFFGIIYYFLWLSDLCVNLSRP